MIDTNPRERMVTSAAELIQQRGVSGVGLREVAAHAGAPRGSLQHYFPGGKAQLVADALAHADQVGADRCAAGWPRVTPPRSFSPAGAPGGGAA